MSVGGHAEDDRGNARLRRVCEHVSVRWMFEVPTSEGGAGEVALTTRKDRRRRGKRLGRGCSAPASWARGRNRGARRGGCCGGTAACECGKVECVRQGGRSKVAGRCSAVEHELVGAGNREMSSNHAGGSSRRAGRTMGSSLARPRGCEGWLVREEGTV